MTTPPARFQDNLLTALLSEHAVLTGPAHAVSADPAPALPRSRSRVRPLALSLTAGVAAAGAAAAVVTLAVPRPVPPLHAGHRHAGAGHRHPGARPAPVATAPAVTGSGGQAAHIQNVSFVVHRMLGASQVDTSVVDEVVHAPNSQTGAPTVDEIWSQHGNPSSFDVTLDASGQPVSGTLLTQRASGTTSTTIDYAAHTYRTQTYSPAPAGGPAPAPATLSGNATQLRAAVANGSATLVGTATVDGRSTVEITASDPHGTIQMYVDPDTYLVVRELDIPVGGTPSGSDTITDDSRYLPDTAANRAKLTPAGVIPPGFHRG